LPWRREAITLFLCGGGKGGKKSTARAIFKKGGNGLYQAKKGPTTSIYAEPKKRRFVYPIQEEGKG